MSQRYIDTEVVEIVRDVWTSLFSPYAIRYKDNDNTSSTSDLKSENAAYPSYVFWNQVVLVL